MYKRQVVKCRESRERARSEAIDRVVTNKYLALPLFFAIMLGIFFLTFEVIGAFLSDLLAAGIDALTAAVDSGLAAYGLNPVVHSLVIDGVFAGEMCIRDRCAPWCRSWRIGRGSRASAASPPSTGRCWTACWRSFR